MPRRHYQPTFLLNCTVFVFVIAAGFGTFALARVFGSGLPLLIGLAAGAFLLLISDLIIGGVVALLTWRANRTGKQCSSLWFVEVEEEQRRQRERFYEDTKDNPTLR